MSSPSWKGRLCNMKVFFLFNFFCVLLPVAVNGLPFSSPEHNTLMPATDNSNVNIPDTTLETNSEGLLEILAGLVKKDSPPGNVGQLTKGFSSLDVPAELVGPLPEHKTLMPAKDQSDLNNPEATERADVLQLDNLQDNSLLDKTKISPKVVEKKYPFQQGYKIKPFHSENEVFEDNLQTPALKVHVNHKIPSGVDLLIDPTGFKPPAKLDNTLSTVFLVLIVLLFLIDVVRFSKHKIRRYNAARMKERESDIAEPPLTLTSRVWVGISSLFGPKEAASPPQLFPVSDDDAEKSISTTGNSNHEKKFGRRTFSWRLWRPTQRIVPQNNPVLDTVPFIEVPLTTIHPPLEKVVCHHIVNHQTTDKPCYTGSGLPEVSIS
ncbi:uncharacterized protein LOC109616709 [Esox lucius]|uniref:uncharacterized protein LOC109616709 n=1 Tax=Esox lucius TaxID=8010 RepID=UPI0014769895|nr:uncharacterized protein LOC109616709 [Esox lucius]